jgi:hypothetical protein
VRAKLSLSLLVLALPAAPLSIFGAASENVGRGLPSPLTAGAAEIVSVHALRDTEDQTALTAIESWLHAASEGDANAIAAKMRWTWRENAHRLFADVAAPWAEKARSPEKFVALAEVAAFAGIGRVEVFTQMIVSASEEIVAVRAFGVNGRVTEHLFWMRWSGGRWLRVVTSSTVARLTRRLAAGQPLDTTEPATFREQYEWIVTQTGPKPALPAP